MVVPFVAHSTCGDYPGFPMMTTGIPAVIRRSVIVRAGEILQPFFGVKAAAGSVRRRFMEPTLRSSEDPPMSLM
jgi:hypothetical protein